MYNNEPLQALYAFMKLLDKEKIIWSLSPDNYKSYKNNINLNVDDLEICIYIKDFFRLKSLFNSYFEQMDENQETSLHSYFVYKNTKIKINLIFTTTTAKINLLLNNKLGKGLKIWSQKYKNIFKKLMRKIHSKPSLDKIFISLDHNEYEVFYVLGCSLKTTLMFQNININQCHSIPFFDWKLPVFRDFQQIGEDNE